MTVMGAIHCCKDCVPPERHVGCHSTCEKYLLEKEVHDAYVQAVREGREEASAGLSAYFLEYVRKNGKKRRKGQP